MPWEGKYPRVGRSQIAEEVGITLGEKLNLVQIMKMVSSVFWGLVALTILAGISAYRGWLAPGFSVFLFVTLGWIVSLSLHEFGHALVAYWGGDFSVINKGYLTLNPLRYTHGFLSVVMPLIYLALGGIGLPGGAVYIDRSAIPSKRMQSLVSGGGPIMTTVFTGVLAIPFVFGLQGDNWVQHKEFWAGLSFLTFLQISALFFNLLPIPGLDGFGIILPYLPPSVVARIGSLGSLTFLIIFIFFFQDTPIRRGFWTLVGLVSSLIGIDSQLVVDGFGIYRFW
jgi:Zn-dependent protease